MAVYAVAGLMALALAGLLLRRTRKAALGLMAACLLGMGGIAAYVRAYGMSALINPGPSADGPSSAALGIRITPVARNLDTPWAVAFLPDGRFLVTERGGTLKLLRRDGSLQRTVRGVPAVAARGQGGLLDIILHPDFARNNMLYFSFAEADPRQPARAGTAVARARFQNDALQDVAVIFRQHPKVDNDNHWGSRLLLVPGAKPDAPHFLYISLGDRHAFRPQVQRLDSHIGKIIRLIEDGRVPADNPFVRTPGARPDIFTYGHRNSQGIVQLPSGAVLMHEHGPRGGDELNLLQPGANYGWPDITYGREYSGSSVGRGLQTMPGMVQPLHIWVPSIAPSGMAVLTSDVYPRWKGSVFIGSLAHRALVRLQMNGTRVVREERLLTDLEERIRDVRQGPDGKLYVLTDSESGQLLRIDPN